MEEKITIGNTIINNNDYVMADIDGVVVIPEDKAEDILLKSEKLIATESEIRKAIREGMDPQEAYIKFSVF
jgi:regulator of RNase E activity RraA